MDARSTDHQSLASRRLLLPLRLMFLLLLPLHVTWLLNERTCCWL
jgi:hypothetical protein